MMKHYKVQHYVGIIIGALVVVLSLLLTYFITIDGKIVNEPIVFSMDKDNVVTDKEVYTRGETVQGHFIFCKKRNIKTLVQWTLVDHTLTFFPSKNSTIKKGCYDTWVPIAEIPKSVTPYSAMYFEGLIQYQVNPFSVVGIPLKTNPFQVL